MALQSYTIAVGNLQDDTSGNNYAVNKAVYILKQDKTIQPIFSDLEGNTPITQDGVNNVTNNRGEFSFYVEPNDYIARVGGIDKAFSVVGSDYFNNQVDDAVNLIIDSVAGRGAYYPVGSFEAGFTYTDINQVGTYGAAPNITYYVYTGGFTNLPHTVPEMTDPTASNDYSEVIFPQDVNTSIWGDRFKGSFAIGFTYSDVDDVGLGQDGNYYSYVGGDTLPVNVSTGTIPSNTPSDYKVENVVDSDSLSRNDIDVTNDLLLKVSTGDDFYINSGSQSSASIESSTDLRLLKGQGDLSLKIYNQNLSGDDTRAITAPFNPSNKPTLQKVMDKMKNGDAVKIACFGDSTTAGIATTGFTANQSTGGEAAGQSDETANSPNAYPFLMRSMLSDMYDNTALKVYNNGYSGQAAVNGWALRNYASAVVNNPAIGHPDICLIQFGLNDVNEVGYDLQTFIDEMEKLIALQIGFGTLPVLVSSQPSSTGAGGNRDNKLMETLDDSKKQLAHEWNIPFLDHHEEIKYFMANNREWRNDANNYRWARIQNDGTHTNDYGHQFKASFFSAMLYSGTVFLDGQQEYVATWDSRANTIADFDDNEGGTNPKNTRLHKNAVIDSCPASSNLMRVYVWNRGLNTACIYRGIGNEGYAGAGGTPPRAIIEKLSTLKSQDSYVVQSSFETTEHLYSSSDVPHYVGGLSFGLNLVRYVSGSIAGYNAHFGSFEFVSDFNLSDSRRVISGLRFKDNVQSALNAKELPFMANVVSIPSATNEALRMHIDARVPQGSGVVLWWTQAFDGTAASWTFDRKILVTLYRNTSNQIVIKLIKWANNGYQGEQVLLTSSALTQTDDDIKLLVVINRSATGQRWRIFEDDVLDPPWVLDSTILFSDIMAPWAGICGGAYNNDANLREVHIKSIDAWYA